MKKKRFLLLSGITCILISAVPMFSYSGAGPSASKKSSAPSCPTIINKMITLNLSFELGFVNGCQVPESFLSDFRSVPGASLLTDNSKYFCKITVTQVAPIAYCRIRKSHLYEYHGYYNLKFIQNAS